MYWAIPFYNDTSYWGWKREILKTFFTPGSPRPGHGSRFLQKKVDKNTKKVPLKKMASISTNPGNLRSTQCIDDIIGIAHWNIAFFIR